MSDPEPSQIENKDDDEEQKGLCPILIHLQRNADVVTGKKEIGKTLQ